MTNTEKVAYIRGLAEGLELDDSKKEVKVLNAIIDLLDDLAMSLADLEDGYSEIVIVDKARDSADIKLANLLQKGDVVITQDYGVAAMALGKGAAALDQNGRIYNEENMDRLLFERYLGQKNRCVGGASHRAMGMKGPKRRTAEEDASFEKSLCRLLEIPTKE